MGSRTTIPIAALTLLITTGCGHADVPSQTGRSTWPPAPPPARPSSVAPTDASATPPFQAVSREVKALATSFVQRIVEYDTTREGRLAFLRGVRGRATPAELDRL